VKVAGIGGDGVAIGRRWLDRWDGVAIGLQVAGIGGEGEEGRLVFLLIVFDFVSVKTLVGSFLVHARSWFDSQCVREVVQSMARLTDLEDELIDLSSLQIINSAIYIYMNRPINLSLKLKVSTATPRSWPSPRTLRHGTSRVAVNNHGQTKSAPHSQRKKQLPNKVSTAHRPKKNKNLPNNEVINQRINNFYLI
jgi:hypothetical protein